MIFHLISRYNPSLKLLDDYKMFLSALSLHVLSIMNVGYRGVWIYFAFFYIK